MELDKFLDRSPDSLSLRERTLLTGKWIALELYTPKTLPLRKMAALGDTAADAVRMLQSRGLDPTRYELMPLKRPM